MDDIQAEHAAASSADPHGAELACVAPHSEHGVRAAAILLTPSKVVVESTISPASTAYELEVHSATPVSATSEEVGSSEVEQGQDEGSGRFEVLEVEVALADERANAGIDAAPHVLAQPQAKGAMPVDGVCI